MNNFDVLDLWWLSAERLGHFDEPIDFKNCAFSVFFINIKKLCCYEGQGKSGVNFMIIYFI